MSEQGLHHLFVRAVQVEIAALVERITAKAKEHAARDPAPDWLHRIAEIHLDIDEAVDAEDVAHYADLMEELAAIALEQAAAARVPGARMER